MGVVYHLQPGPSTQQIPESYEKAGKFTKKTWSVGSLVCRSNGQQDFLGRSWMPSMSKRQLRAILLSCQPCVTPRQGKQPSTPGSSKQFDWHPVRWGHTTLHDGQGTKPSPSRGEARFPGWPIGGMQGIYGQHYAIGVDSFWVTMPIGCLSLAQAHKRGTTLEVLRRQIYSRGEKDVFQPSNKE